VLVMNYRIGLSVYWKAVQKSDWVKPFELQLSFAELKTKVRNIKENINYTYKGYLALRQPRRR